MTDAKNEAACGASHSDTGLAACPCGNTPTDIDIYDACQGGKWANVVPNCCGEWMIEFRTTYAVGDELKKLAIEAWNTAPRAANAIELTGDA